MDFDYHSNNPESSTKKTKFAESSIQYKEKPSKKLYKEPKTPFVEYDGEDDAYLMKLKEINTIDPVYKSKLNLGSETRGISEKDGE